MKLSAPLAPLQPPTPSASRRDDGGNLGATLGNIIIVCAGLAVAIAAIFDQWLYFALGVASLMFLVAAFQKPYLGLLVWLFAFPVLDPYVRIDLPGGVPNITMNRVAVALVMVSLMLAVMLRRRRLLPMGPIEASMLLLSAIMLGDIYIRSESAGEDVLLLLDEYLTPFLLFVAFKNLVAGGADVRKALLALALSCLYLAPHGAYQFITHSDPPFWIGPPDTVHSLVEEQGRARGPFTDSVSYGALGNVVFLSALFLLGWSQKLSHRLLLTMLLAGAGGIVLLALTRSVWLGLLMALLLAIVWERRLRPIVLALLLAGTLSIGAGMLFLTDSAEAVSERATDYETVYIRIALYNAALTMAVQQPFIGYGRHATEQFQRDRPKYVSDFMGIGAEWGILAGPPHNALISMTLMYGVFGTAVYASIFVRIVRSLRALRRLRVDAPLPPAAYGTFMLTLTVIYVSVGMFTDVMAFNFFGNIYFMLAGGAEGLRIFYASRAADNLQIPVNPSGVPELARPA